MSIILLSSVLQYIEDPYKIIEKLSTVGADYLIIDRTTFYDKEEDMILIQHVPSWIYQASYPMRVFAKSKFIETLNKWNIVASNLCPEGHVRSSDGIRFYSEGLLMDLRK